MKKEATLTKSKTTGTVASSAKIATATSVNAEKEAIRKEETERKKAVAKVIVKKDKEEKKSVQLPKAEHEEKQAAGKVEVFVQFSNQEVITDAVLERVKKAYIAQGNEISDQDNIRVYIKPEENMIYYVINDSYASGIVLYE